MPSTKDDDANGADEVRKSVALPVPPERVFAALTDPDLVQRWLADVASIDPRTGGDVELIFQNRNGTISVIGGEVTEFAPPRCLAFHWHSPSWPFPPLHVRFALEPTAGGTRLGLVHRGFANLPLERDIHDRGWDHYLTRLAELVQKGD